MSKGLVELLKAFPNFQPKASVVIGGDVRRNTQSILDSFSGGLIYVFEPNRAGYESLHSEYGSSDRVILERRSLGSKSGTVYMTRLGISESPHAPNKVAGAEPLKVERGDEYFRAEGVDRIGLLTTSCRQWDFEVLGGLGSYLTTFKITFIQMRCGFTLAGNVCRIQDAMELLLPLGYQVISIFSSSRIKLGDKRGPGIASSEFLFAHPAALEATEGNIGPAAQEERLSTPLDASPRSGPATR